MNSAGVFFKNGCEHEAWDHYFTLPIIVIILRGKLPKVGVWICMVLNYEVEWKIS